MFFFRKDFFLKMLQSGLHAITKVFLLAYLCGGCNLAELVGRKGERFVLENSGDVRPKPPLENLSTASQIV